MFQSSSSRHISTSTVQRRLQESGLHGRIAAKKPLLRKNKKKKIIAWSQWKSVLWSDDSKFEIFGSKRCVFVRRREGEDSFCMCGSHREVWKRRCDGVG